MDCQEELDNKKYYNNVKKVVMNEYFFSVSDDMPTTIESCTYNDKGQILSKSNNYSERFGDVSGFDLDNSSEEYFYNENDWLKKIISYDENLEIDCVTEYSYNDENKLNLIKVDRFGNYQTTEFHYYHNKVIKILVSSITGEVKRDIIFYDNSNRIISEESIFRKIEGNYSVKNLSKRYIYNEDLVIIESFTNGKINSKETSLSNGKLIERINYSENEEEFSRVNVEYSDDFITTVCSSPMDEQIFKTIDFLDANSKRIKSLRYGKEDVLTYEIIYKYDKFNNCIYEEMVDYSKTIIDFEYH